MSKTERIAFIREAECIGCTKCIQACPVDAIIGAAQLMHTVIKDLCIGCDLCVAPCPVDCIDMLEIEDHSSAEEQKEKARQAKQRFQSRKVRLKLEASRKDKERQQRISQFKASPGAHELIRNALEKAASARAGRTDHERMLSSIEKLEGKLKSMREELAMARNNRERTEELERRIETWTKKLQDEKEELGSKSDP